MNKPYSVFSAPKDIWVLNTHFFKYVWSKRQTVLMKRWLNIWVLHCSIIIHRPENKWTVGPFGNDSPYNLIIIPVTSRREVIITTSKYVIPCVYIYIYIYDISILHMYIYIHMICKIYIYILCYIYNINIYSCILFIYIYIYNPMICMIFPYFGWLMLMTYLIYVGEGFPKLDGVDLSPMPSSRQTHYSA